MIGLMKVFGGVLVFRGVAASDVSAYEAEAKMHPSVADCETFFAPGSTRLHFAYFFQVSAFLLWHGSLRRRVLLAGSARMLAREKERDPRIEGESTCLRQLREEIFSLFFTSTKAMPLTPLQEFAPRFLFGVPADL
jgi:hypothetical protein